MLRLLIFPLALLASAFGMVIRFFGPENDPEQTRIKGLFGWLSPEMDHVFADLREEPTFHHLKGLLTGWCKLFPKTAAKLGSLIVVVLLASLVVAVIF